MWRRRRAPLRGVSAVVVALFAEQVNRVRAQCVPDSQRRCAFARGSFAALERVMGPLTRAFGAISMERKMDRSEAIHSLLEVVAYELLQFIREQEASAKDRWVPAAGIPCMAVKSTILRYGKRSKIFSSTSKPSTHMS